MSKSAQRAVRFELHILPMFRLIDREHMMVWFDLYDPATFYAADGSPKMSFIKSVAKHLKGELTQMPPVYAGGPWPSEWIDLFDRWIAEGCKRLELSVGQYNATRLNDTSVKLSAMAEVPSDDYEVWLQRENTGPSTWVYKLYQEGQGAGDSPATKFIAEEINDIPSSVSFVMVHDLEGAKTVTIDDGSGPIV